MTGIISVAPYENSEKISGQGIGELLKQVWGPWGVETRDQPDVVDTVAPNYILQGHGVDGWGRP
jgi:hypothetical protein